MVSRWSRRAAAAAIALAVLVTASGAGAAAQRRSVDDLTGAGSTFVAPLVAQWIQEWSGKSGSQVTYAPVGSGGGIAAISARTVDFGASDAPLSPDQFTKCNGCVQIPWALSATAIAYKLKGAPAHLHITGQVLADIYLGKITRWNDAALQRLNPQVRLPDTPIQPVYRSDGSGTSFNLTDYLAKASPEFRSKVGRSTQPPFPVGVGARGSSGVAGVVSRTDGAIGYFDIAYALANHLSYFDVQNRAGRFATVTLPHILAAAKAFRELAGDNSISIVDPPASASYAYPISTYTYVIAPLHSGKARTLRQFIFYAVSAGQEKGSALVFAPLPKQVLLAAERTISRIQ